MLYRLSNMVYFCWLLGCNVYHGWLFLKKEKSEDVQEHFFYFNVYINHLELNKVVWVNTTNQQDLCTTVKIK